MPTLKQYRVAGFSPLNTYDETPVPAETMGSGPGFGLGTIITGCCAPAGGRVQVSITVANAVFAVTAEGGGIEAARCVGAG